jgi:hypothetical protein
MAEEELEAQPAAFVDANIFLDVGRKRKGWEASSALISEIRQKYGSENQGFISILTTAIIYFTFLGRYSPKESVQELRKLVKGFATVDLSQEDFEEALSDERISDFEDRLQFYAAKKVCHTLVTRNKKHYRNVENEIEILAPEDFLAKKDLARIQSP